LSMPKIPSWQDPKAQESVKRSISEIPLRRMTVHLFALAPFVPSPMFNPDQLSTQPRSEPLLPGTNRTVESGRALATSDRKTTRVPERGRWFQSPAAVARYQH